jgi:hypothetical protein
MTKTYRGSCHCRRVTFEADIDLEAQGTSKCNCSICWKRRAWTTRAKLESFRSLTGEENLRRYPESEVLDGGGFCPTCGVSPYQRIAAQEWNDGAYVSVNVACLDDLDPTELIAAPVQYCDGRNDNWWQAPNEIRHL